MSNEMIECVIIGLMALVFIALVAWSISSTSQYSTRLSECIAEHASLPNPKEVCEAKLYLETVSK